MSLRFRLCAGLIFASAAGLILAAPTSAKPKEKSQVEVHDIKGHRGELNDVAYSPDGKLIASGATDGTVRIWSRESASELRKMQGDDESVLCVAFSPTGRQLAAGGMGGRVKIWDTATGKELRDIEAHSDYVRDVAFSPDGRYLATGGDDTLVRTFDARTWRPVHTFEGHTDYVRGVAFSLDGRYVASAGWDSTINIWDMKSGFIFRDLDPEGSAISIAFSPGGKYLAAGTAEDAKVWDTSTWQPIHKFTAHSEWVWSVAFSPDGKRLATGGEDNMIRVWDLKTGETLRELTGHRGAVTGLAFSPEGFQLASSSKGGALKTWTFIGKGQAFYVVRPDAPLKSASGRRLTKLPKGARCVVKLTKGSLWFVGVGQNLKGWIDKKHLSMVKPDLTKPIIRILKKSYEEPELYVKGVVYDDIKVARVLFGGEKGRLLERASFEVSRGNYPDAYPFEAKVTVTPGMKLSILAEDRTAKKTKLPISIAEPAVDYEPLFAALRVLKRGSLREKATTKSRRLSFARKGSTLYSAGRKKNWYYVEGGGWIHKKLVLEVEVASLGDTSLVVKAKQAPKRIVADVDTPPKTATRTDPDAYAVVIGIEKYRDVPGVDFASRDAKTVYAYLTEAMGFDPGNVIMLADERATRTDLEKYLGRWLKNQATRSSRIFVFYAGHGAPNPATGEGFLIPYDGDPGYTDSTSYPVRKLFSTLASLPSRDVTVVLDACFSGAGGRSVLAKGARPLVMTTSRSDVGKNMVVLSAAQGKQISTYYPEAGHGMLTYFLLKGLQGAADADKNKRITTAELFDYVRPNVQREARKRNVDQSPTLRADPSKLKKAKKRVWLKLK